MEGVTWEGIAMSLGLCALAASSITEVVRKLIMQGVIERSGEKPWWRGTVLRLTSVVSGALFGLLTVEESWRMGLLLGIGAGSLTTEAVGFARKLISRNGNGKPRQQGQRLSQGTDFKPDDKTEFQVAITDEDLKQ